MDNDLFFYAGRSLHPASRQTTNLYQDINDLMR